VGWKSTTQRGRYLKCGGGVPTGEGARRYTKLGWKSTTQPGAYLECGGGVPTGEGARRYTVQIYFGLLSSVVFWRTTTQLRAFPYPCKLLIPSPFWM